MEKIDQSQIYIIGIGKLLSEGKLSVPAFQRNYSWVEKHITELLSDLYTSFSNNNEDYFLGTIVVVRKREEKKEIVDGQQRLATTAILICSIRDYIKLMADPDSDERARVIEADYLFKRNRRTLEKIQNLTLNEIDDPFFSMNILASSTPEMHTHRPSHVKLKDSYCLCSNFIKNFFTSSDPDHLLRFLDFLESQAKVIHIQVDDESYAYTIFETLNDRGLELSELDLVKNLLFSHAGASLEAVRSNWNEMLSHLEALNKERLHIDFLRHFWSCLHGLTRSRELYSKIRAKIKSREDSVSFSEQLAFASLTYSALLNSESEIWNSYSHDTKVSIRTLNLLGMQQNRPLILAVLTNFSLADVEKTIANLVSWAIRYIVTGKLGSSQLEDNFAGNAHKVWSGKIKSYPDLYIAMKNTIPNDEDFKKAALLWSISRADIARYILRSIEDVASQNRELSPKTSPKKVNLEHILPKKPDYSIWSEFSPDEHRNYYKRLGNLCLLESGVNGDIGNASFSEKKPMFASSKITTTAEIQGYQTWNKLSIENRQTKLVEVAVKCWPMTT